MKKENFKIVADIIREELALDKVEAHDNIADLGADSLDIVEIIVKTEETFNIEISDEEVLNVITVRDLVDIVEEHLGC